MAGFSFSQQGATPQSNANSFIGSYGSSNSFLAGQTPAGKALAGAANMSTSAGPRYAAPPVAAPMSFATPTTPVKKQVVTNSDGSTHTTEYHAPEPGLLTSTQNKDTTSTQPAAFASDPAGGGGHAVIPTEQPISPASGGAVIPQNSQSGFLSNGNVDISSQLPGGATQLSNSQPQYSASNPPTYPGLISSLTNTASQPSASYTSQLNTANQYNTALQQSLSNEGNDLQQNRLNPIPIGDQTGREAVIEANYLKQQQALGSGFQGASTLLGATNTQQGLQQSGLTSALGAAAPQLASFNQQAFNPITGQFAGGTSLNDAVSTIAQRIQTGQMSYDQGIAALGGYGQGGTNALQQALGPNFNVAQSNALAGQQGTIGPAYTYAKTALSNLQNAVAGLNGVQNTNIPIINSITQGLSTTFGVGSEGVQAYKGALAEARSAIQKVLASVQGGTPTDYVGQSNALLPDNATPAQISAASQTLDTLGQAKVDIYGNPGASTTNTNQNGSNPPGWF